MPENEFEKKVSSEMQKLKFTPSEKVWPLVEERIREKNKRRVFVIIFLLAGLALLGYWQRGNLFGEKKNNIVKTETQKEDDPETSEGATNNSPTTTKTTATPKENEISNVKKTDNKKETGENTNNKTVTEKLANEGSSVRKNNKDISGNKISPAGKKRNALRPVKNKTEGNASKKIQPGVVSTPQKDISQPAKDTVIDPAAKNDKKPDQFNNDQVNVPDKQSPTNDTINNKAQLPVKNTEEKIDTIRQKQNVSPEQNTKPGEKQRSDSSKKDKKWHAGLNIQVGSSNTVKADKLIWNQRGRFAMDYASGAGGGGVSYDPSHEVRSRMSFGLGVFARKDLSKKFHLNLGLNYSLLRTGLRVGRQMPATQAVSNPFSSNSSINNFYRPPVIDSNKVYINNYHFLGLQSEIGWQFSNWPLSVNLGLAYSRLLNTNSLIYESRLPGFYQDKTAFVKDHLFISGGLSLRIADGKKYSFELNPFAEGSLTKVFARSDSAQLHYTNVGMRLRIISKK